MTIIQLEYIVAVHSYKSFSVAANHCFVTQPSLSMQIQKLEDELGVLIFDRSKNPIATTDVGEKLIRQAKVFLQERDRLQSIVENEKGDFSGILRIGIIPTIAPFLLPLFLKSFVDKYPRVELVLDELTTGEIISGLTKSTIDIGILALPIQDVVIVEEPLYYEPFVGFIPESHKLFSKDKLDVTDIDAEDLLLLKEGHCLRDQTLKVCKTSEKEWNENHSKILFEFGSLETLINLVQQNFGMTLLPYLAIRYMKDDSRLKLVREFNSPVPKREIGIVYSETIVKKHFAAAVKKEILSSIPKELINNKEGLIIQ